MTKTHRALMNYSSQWLYKGGNDPASNRIRIKQVNTSTTKKYKQGGEAL